MRRSAALLLLLSLTSNPAWSQPDTGPAGEGRIIGRVVTDDGAAIDGAVVSALLFTTGPAAAATFSTTTSSDGGYVIERLPQGRFRVFAEKSGYSNLVVQPGRMEGGRVVDLEAASTVSGIDLVLRRTSSIAGRVTRPDGTPVEKARVAAEIRLPNGQMVGTGPGAPTGADGRYRLDAVPPGTYVVTAMYGDVQRDARDAPQSRS